LRLGQAYIGPGAGITLLSAIWGVIVAFFLAIGAVLFWPIRILIRRRRNRAAKVASEKAASAKSAQDSSD
jgi:flagellar biosynthesis/type III secretory pathway M-ring protein FliF/YscJ